jgi:hypothetical protein
VSNIWDADFGGHHIKYGSQIADHITMSVSAVAIKGTPADPLPCFGVQKKNAATKKDGVKKSGEVHLMALTMEEPKKQGWKPCAARRHDSAI